MKDIGKQQYAIFDPNQAQHKQNTRNASNATASFSTEDDAANQMNVIEEETHVVETVHKTREDESCPLDVVSTADNVPISSSPSIAQKTLHQDALSEWKTPIDNFLHRSTPAVIKKMLQNLTIIFHVYESIQRMS